MAWFLVPAGGNDSISKRNINSSLEKKFAIGLHLGLLPTKVVDELRYAGVDDYVHMWGAKYGENNPGTWGRMKQGDKVIFFASGKYMYYGIVLTKAIKQSLADIVWPPKKKKSGVLSDSFMYLYFLVDVQKIAIDEIPFNTEFGYPNSPRGFMSITNERIKNVSAIHGSVESTLEHLMSGNPLLKTTISKVMGADEEVYQTEMENTRTPAASADTTPKLPRTTRVGGRTTYYRDPSVSYRAIVDADYLCEINNSHVTFTSKVSGNNFVEAHHLIPMSCQEDFLPDSLDVTPNIISLCPICHRALHHAQFTIKESMLKKIFSRKRKADLKKCNLSVDIDTLLDYYS